VNLNNFLAELKRRNVYRVGIAYGVVAWLLIQIATQVFPFFAIPSWVARLVVLLSMIGFPIALVFSWLFEMTPEGIKLTEEAAPNETMARGVGRKLDLLIIGVLFAVITILIFQRVHPRVSPVPKKSIAVLPFENLSANQEKAYFADGVQNEILTDLAKIADLKVISRTSVMQYRSGSARNLREIAKQLGVAHLLEGSVQWDSGKVRVNAQLIDAGTDAQLWAQTYDRDLADLFEIQSEIAKAIADQLQAKLSPREIAAIQERPTRDLVAYDLHVHAVSLIDEASYYGLSEAKNFFQAVELLNQAITRDPAFLLAYCELAQAHDEIYWNEIDHTPARLDLATAAIKSAFQLKSDSGEAHLAQAVHYYKGYLDYDRAREELAIAVRTMPNSARIFEWRGYIDRRQGRGLEAARAFAQAMELDPQNRDLLFGAAFTDICLRAYKHAREVSDRGLALKSKNNYIRLLPGWIDFHERAETRTWQSALEQILSDDPASSVDLTRQRFFLNIYRRDAAAAEQALAGLAESSLRGRGIGAVEFSRVYAHGLVAQMKGDQAGANAAYSEARVQQALLVRTNPPDGSALCFLGLINAALGRKKEALEQARRAIELLPVTKDALNGAEVLYFYAVICAWTGERDLAIEQLKILAEIPAGVSYGEICLDPFWDPLRGDPGFEQILASLAPKPDSR